MIKRIIDMDQKAREITDAALQEKLHCEDEIAEKAAALREDYLDRARKRAQINLETDRTLFEQEWRKRKAQYAVQTARLEALFADKREEWVEAIVDRVIRQ